MVCKHYYRITIGILYTETFTNYLLFISLNFAGFFGKREIIVMLIILICFCATLRAFYFNISHRFFAQSVRSDLGIFYAGVLGSTVRRGMML